MPPTTRSRRPKARRHPALGAVVAVLILVGVGGGQGTLASASANARTAVVAGPDGAAQAPALPLVLPAELRLDTVADAATRGAELDARLAALETALTGADAALATSTGAADETLRTPLADAVQKLRSLRGERASSDIPARTATVVRLTGPVAAAAASYRADQLRLAAEAQAQAQSAAAAAAPAAAPATGTDVIALGEATLRSLPGNAGVHLAWNAPGIGTRLGGVFLNQTSEIMINGRGLAATPGRTASVVEHEIAHIYQARIIAAEANARGGWSASHLALVSRLDSVFGSNGLERSADCVALRLGATWVAYSNQCSGARQAVVDALLAGRMP